MIYNNTRSEATFTKVVFRVDDIIWMSNGPITIETREETEGWTASGFVNSKGHHVRVYRKESQVEAISALIDYIKACIPSADSVDDDESIIFHSIVCELFKVPKAWLAAREYVEKYGRSING